MCLPEVNSFREETPPPRWFRFVGGGEILGAVGLWAGAFSVRSEMTAGTLVAVTVGGAVLFIIGWVTATARIVVEISPAEVAIAYGVIRVARLSRLDLAAVATEYLSAASFGGLGLRAFPGGRAVLFSSGRGVKIETTAGATLHLRTDRGAEIVDLLTPGTA
jgi:hypothetical protein